MLMVTRLIRVMTYHKELPPINSSFQSGGHLRSLDKFNTLYLDLQKIYAHQSREGAD